MGEGSTRAHARDRLAGVLIDTDYYEQPGLWGAHHVENAEALARRFAAVHELLPDALGSILEVGSGDGRVLDHLTPLRPRTRMLALDRSREALRHQRRPSVVGSLDQLPFRARSADAVLCCEVLEHLDHEGFEVARRELARIADRCVVITVPNRENRRRSAVRCPACGCQYNPIRHLRSFDPESLRTLLPGFRLVEVLEAGPRVVVYPRVLRRGLEAAGLLHRSGEPTCPQCGAPLSDRRQPGPPGGGPAATTSRLHTTAGGLRRLAPKSRRRYWLCARYERTG